MDANSLTMWILGGLASALGALILLLLSIILRRLTSQDTALESIQRFINTELRLFDVRLSILENIVKSK